jgi:hypothetical protein
VVDDELGEGDVLGDGLVEAEGVGEGDEVVACTNRVIFEPNGTDAPVLGACFQTVPWATAPDEGGALL